MKSFLFVVPPLTGHVNPAVGVASRLVEEGHRVTWVGHHEVIGRLLPPDAALLPAGDRFLGHAAAVLEARERLRGVSALRFLWSDFLLPLAEEMVPHVLAAAEYAEPDVIVADQQALAGGLVASLTGCHWATSATTTAELTNPLGLVPKVGEWIDAQLAELAVAVGADPAVDPRFSPELVLAYSTRALTGPVPERPNLQFVGPILNGRPLPALGAWPVLDSHERSVLVSVGTVNGDIGLGFLRRMVEAVAGEPYGVIISAPDPAALLGAPATAPSNVMVRPSVPQLGLLPHLDAVVCHAGHNTVCESLAHGLPLVVAPIRDDQPVIADQVTRSGAGRRVSFARATPAELRSAVADVLDTSTYRRAAAGIARSFRVAGGAVRAAEHLVALAERPAPATDPAVIDLRMARPRALLPTVSV